MDKAFWTHMMVTLGDTTFNRPRQMEMNGIQLHTHSAGHGSIIKEGQHLSAKISRQLSINGYTI